MLPHMASWLDTNDCLFLKPSLIGKIFLTSDIITFLVQLGGSGMAASADLAMTGEKVSLSDSQTAVLCRPELTVAPRSHLLV